MSTCDCAARLLFERCSTVEVAVTPTCCTSTSGDQQLRWLAHYSHALKSEWCRVLTIACVLSWRPID